MSSYLNSFLIEPVVRQARRFSRPSLSRNNSSGPACVQAECSDDGTPYVRLVEICNLEPHHRARQYVLQSVPDHSHAVESERLPQTDETPAPENAPQPSTQLALPEDDGMALLRRRIQSIQRLDIPTQEKAFLVHQVMTEGHQTAKVASTDRPITPCSPLSAASEFVATSPPTSYSSFESNPNPFNLIARDLVPSYRVRQSVVEENDPGLGCEHYKRNIKLQCSSCQRWYPCRFCHDTVEGHLLNRRATRHMLCMLCGCAQAASSECVSCSVPAAWYYCDVCKLWDDDDSKAIYHCHDCGICRLGQGLGKDFFHCQTCCVCIPIAVRESHRCIERATDSNCPICGDYLFDSPQTVVFMQCGHSIHHACYWQHISSSYKCPLCSRSIINMDMQFARLQRSIDSQPMPEEFRETAAWISCNDCTARTSVPYHWLGLKCAVQLSTLVLKQFPKSKHEAIARRNTDSSCDSYNTVQLSLSSTCRDTSHPTRPILRPRSYSLDTRKPQQPLRQRARTVSLSGSRPEVLQDDDCQSELEFWGDPISWSALASPALPPSDSVSEHTSSESEADDPQSEEDLLDILGHR